MSARGLEKILREFDLERVVDQCLDLIAPAQAYFPGSAGTSASKSE